ncbi:Predicted acetyltransferase [Pannonibacter phragmitetus]|uniref:Predicted acetyltransferase n=1 Tax=Pannonibacter phragmitetus TaxID=121719 RepID=A0A378ZYN8_9HYPH|nr:GNAT family N-acetyltransferase [Pannonibacter phragmitetus]SUB02198.1 Predicted acetyltransferase [Pannonibacter phragmitetus]
MLTDETLTIQPMEPEHLAGALRLSQAEKWPHRAEDWSLLHSLSKGAVAIENGEAVATALTTPFGDVATINMIIVDGRMRGRGLGRKMMTSVMSLIQPQQWRLVATKDGLPLYEKLGFRAVGGIFQHQGIARAPEQVPALAGEGADGLHLAGPEDAPVLAQLDKAATGMDRTSLISALFRTGKFLTIRENGRITAFAALRPFGRGEVAGPVIAHDADQARQLLSWCLKECEGRFLRVDTGAETGLAPWLAEHGLGHAGGGIPMRLGAASDASGPVHTFALAAQALG